MSAARLTIILRGVGGQLLPFFVRRLATRLADRARSLQIDETYGMAQRGGAVVARLGVELDVPGGSGLRRVLLGLERIEGARGVCDLAAGDIAFIAEGTLPPPGPLAQGVAAPPTGEELVANGASLGVEVVMVPASPNSPWAVVQAAIDRGAIP
jgi:hypothetical protein